MSFSARVVSFAILTYFLLGFSTLMQQAAFIVSFPLIPEFSFAMILGISYREFSENKKLSVPFVLLLVYGLLGVLSSQLFLETVFSLEKIIQLRQSGLLDVLKLIQLFLLSAYLLVYARGFAMRWMHIVLLLIILLGIGVNFEWFHSESDQLLLYGWFVLLGIASVLSRKYTKNIENRMPALTNFNLGLAIIHLLSIISIAMY